MLKKQIFLFKVLFFSIGVVVFTTTCAWIFIQDNFKPGTNMLNKKELELRNTIKDILSGSNQSTYLNKPKSKLAGLILASSMRTGSSFTGQLFNQHSDVFYVFEPLFFIQGYGHKSIKKKLTVLKSILTCDFSQMPLLYKEELNIAKQENTSTDRILKCQAMGFCFGNHNRAMCNNGMCQGQYVNEICSFCHLPNWENVKNMCLKSKLRVIKSIRIYDLQWLEELFSDPQLDLHVIHLIRDPRAIYNSRHHIEPYQNVDRFRYICELHLKFETQLVEIKQQNTTVFKPRKLMSVRYEDVISEPKLFTNLAYKFIDSGGTNKILPTQEVYDFIKKSTVISDNQTYGTSRLPSEQFIKWRKELDFQTVSDIQNTCEKMMKLFGYKEITESEQMLNFTKTLF